MRFAFRVDSSPKIGMGHLMRCLTLADGLKTRGFDCCFICRDFNGNGAERVQNSGFKLELLSNEDVKLDDTWLGVPYSYDAKETINAISQKPIDWLVIDHYGIDHRWEFKLRSKFPDVKIMVIDDLANRKHDCDLLLDQTYGRVADEYKALCSSNTQFCLGTEFALLRPQFSKLREHAQLGVKPTDDSCHILVTLGGGDNHIPIQMIGAALKKLCEDYQFSATVITGNTPDNLLADYKSLKHNVELISFSSDIEDEMIKANFVIGAGGGTSWERCCLGLPTIVLTIANNQIEIAKILNDKKAGISVETDVYEIMLAVKKLLNDSSLREEMSENAARLCDGYGVKRVIGEIFSSSMKIRLAGLEDAQFIHEARYQGNASQFYRNKEIPTFEQHISWLEKALLKGDYILAIVMLADKPIAHVRLDKNNDENNTGDIGICIAMEMHGMGLGKSIIKLANQYFFNLGFSKIYADVNEKILLHVSFLSNQVIIIFLLTVIVLYAMRGKMIGILRNYDPTFSTLWQANHYG